MIVAAHNLKNLAGQRFGRLRVVERGPSLRWKTTARSRWKCECDCGRKILTTGTALRRGSTTSCGCYKLETSKRNATKHGEAGTKGARGSDRYELWRGARGRARELGLPFDLALDDIVVPERCPVLGLELKPATTRYAMNSPSLDRIVPALGYVRGNVAVISQRANLLKSDATTDELRAVIAYMEDHLDHRD